MVSPCAKQVLVFFGQFFVNSALITTLKKSLQKALKLLMFCESLSHNKSEGWQSGRMHRS